MMYLRNQNMCTERHIYPCIALQDLRVDVIKRVRELVAARDADHPWLRLDNTALLRSAKLYGKDRETGAEGFTLAAALMLGTDDLISDVCPGYRTDAIVRLQDTDRYDDRRIVATNLIDAYDQLSDFARRHLPDPFVLENGAAVSARDIICRELVSNLLIHREYTSPFIAKLVIDANGIRTENASRAIFEGEITLENFNPTPKNPIIADFFHQLGRADELGSGTRNLVKYSSLYSGESPTLHDGDVFVARVPVPWTSAMAHKTSRAEAAPSAKTPRDSARNEIEEAMVRLLKQNGSITSTQLAQAADVTPRTALRHLTDMVKQGKLVASGQNRNRVYRLRS